MRRRRESPARTMLTFCAGACAAAALFVPAGAAPTAPALPVPVPAVESFTLAAPRPLSHLSGRSGRVRAVLATAGKDALDVVRLLFPAPIPPLTLRFEVPGVHDVGVRAPDGLPFLLVALLPFDAKQGAQLGAYRIGNWPQETAPWLSANAAPEGFIEVTRENQDALVSTRFRLRDFLTHDQADVWPKYLVLRMPLIDKLELVADELAREGRPSDVKIMSGFRTPQYNARGDREKSGRAADSRHMYGDAADIFVDANGNEKMDDLNRDGRVTIADARWLAKLVERIEARHPDLVGGLSAYPATSEHGPFVHVDVRGRAARW